MMNLRLACALGLFLVGCSSPESSSPEDLEQTLIERNEELVAFGESQQLSAAVAMHTADAILIPPGGRIVKGTAAIEKMLGAPNGATVHGTKIDTIRVDGSGRLAYSVGRFEYTLTRDTGETVVEGPFVIVWERGDDGEWSVAVDMWNVTR